MSRRAERLKRAAAFAATSGGLRAGAWALALAGSIVFAGLRLYPSAAGKVVLGLIGGGFVLFSVARASLSPAGDVPACCARLLSAGMRKVYFAGYALMFAGVGLTALVLATGLGR